MPYTLSEAFQSVSAMPLIQPDHRHYTYADYSSWPDDVRYELIDGVAYLMSPAPTLDHQDVVGEVYR